MLTYSIPVDELMWSSVFEIMEKVQKTLNIEDYTVNQTSLEQVVLLFIQD